jgi:SAM-dependent methyltransferase
MRECEGWHPRPHECEGWHPRPHDRCPALCRRGRLPPPCYRRREEGVIDTSEPRAWEVLFEIHDGLPREAPGDEASARRALGLLHGLPREPLVLDLGSGPGAATALLARETGGRVVGLDLHAPFLRELEQRARRAGVGSLVHAVRADMGCPPFASRSFDLVWSEGALHSVGFDRGLAIARDLLRPGAHLVATEAVWLDPDPPAEVRRWWQGEYPAIAPVNAKLEAIAAAGLAVLGHFSLPAAAWWEYYGPLEARLVELRRRHAGDAVALDVLEEARVEVEMYRRFGSSYGYELFVCRLFNF